ncbi:MAG: YihY/virulence factor BrkB family protein [Ignavibacteria bacterium]
MSKRKQRFDKAKFISSTKYYFIGLYKKFDEDHIWILSSGIAFNLIICAIPFVLILFSIFGIYLSMDSTMHGIDHYTRNFIGLTPELRDKMHSLIFSRISEISENTTLTAVIGTIGMLWTASGLFSTIRDVLNRIYKTKVEVFYVWGKLKDIGMVFMATLFFVLSIISTFIVSLIRDIDEKLLGNTLRSLGIFHYVIPFMVGLIFSFLMFYVIYKLVPHGNIKNKVVLVSAISSSILWEVVKFIFTTYLVYFSNFKAVYGAYGAIVAVIFWIYYSSFTFVVGAEIGQLYNEKQLIPEAIKTD